MSPRRKIKPKPPPSHAKSGQIDGEDGNEGDGQTDAQSAGKDYRCTLCDSTLGSKSGLYRHMNIHNKRFPCQHCGKCLSQPSSLRTHTCERTFKCTNCDRSFNRRHNLERHHRICIKKKVYFSKHNSRLIVFQDRPVGNQENAAHIQSPLPIPPPNRNVTEEDYMGDYRPVIRIKFAGIGSERRNRIRDHQTERKRLLSLDEDSDDPEILPNNLFANPKSGEKVVRNSFDMEEGIAEVEGNRLSEGERNEVEEVKKSRKSRNRILYTDINPRLQSSYYPDEVEVFESMPDLSYFEQLLAAKGQNQPRGFEENEQLQTADSGDFQTDLRPSSPDQFEPLGEFSGSPVEEPSAKKNKTGEDLAGQSPLQLMPANGGDQSEPSFEETPAEKRGTENSNTGMDRLMKLNKRLIEQLLKIPAEFEKQNQELVEAQKKQFNQLLELLKSEKSLEKNQARKVRREKKRIQQKRTDREPEAVEDLPKITQEDFGLISRCAWCWCTDHSSDHCSKKTCLEERIFYKRRSYLCDLCLIFHPGRICSEVPACLYCPEKDHHPAICPSDAHRQFLAQHTRSPDQLEHLEEVSGSPITAEKNKTEMKNQLEAVSVIAKMRENRDEINEKLALLCQEQINTPYHLKELPEPPVEEPQVIIPKTGQLEQRREILEKKQKKRQKKDLETASNAAVLGENLDELDWQENGEDDDCCIILGDRRPRCGFCLSEEHISDSCSEYLSLEDRRVCCQRYKLCHRCLDDHSGGSCLAQAEEECRYCEETTHHSALCPSEDHLKLLDLYLY